jgi:ABC-type antimicrobial peptide transport system permease subunit
MMTGLLADGISPRRFSAWLFSSFGLSALVITGAGIFGLVAIATRRRAREVGIRIALGATTRTVVAQLLREQMMPIVAGIVAGGLIAAGLVRFAKSYLYKTPLDDPWSWGIAVGSLLVVSALGAAMPTVRAAQVDPIEVLKRE